MADRIAALIPAAGFGTRMRGDDKLLQMVDRIPLIRRSALRAGRVVDTLIVTVPDVDHPRALALQGSGAQIVPVPDNAEGMAASLRRGVAELATDIAAVMIVPGDMPDLEIEDYRRIINAFRATSEPLVHRATTADGIPGHPVLFPARLFAELMLVTGDTGAKTVLKAEGNRVQYVPLPNQNAVIDLDTPEAWSAWRSRRRPT